MNFNEYFDIYDLISRGTINVSSRKRSIQLRKKAFKIQLNQGFNKFAFDTRRINQETEYNPRRGLQNYNRSEEFVSEYLANKLKCFAKLRNVLEDLKNKYGKEHEWQDSNARVLLSTLNNGLRISQNDGDYAINQPGIGSIDYIDQLLHVRYRLDTEDLNKMADSDLKKVILSKDEELTRKDVSNALEITKSDVATQNYDTLLEKLFGGVRATKESPEVERTVTITIKDKFVE